MRRCNVFSCLVVVCATIVLGAGPARGEDVTTFYSFDVRAKDAEILVTVNGIALELFTPGQFGSGPMNAWMINGANQIVFTMTPLGDDAAGSASIDISGKDGFNTLASFEWPGQEGPATFSLEAKGLPTWSWIGAEAVPGADEEVKAAVTGLHAVLKKSDKKEFRRILDAMFADAANLATPEQLELGLDKMWKDFGKNLQPLGDLSVTAFRGGQVYRVVGTNNLGPVQSLDDDGGMFSTGRWWGKIDGRWQLLK